MLQTARGVLDGSVKEPAFPYDPYGGDPGHTEGWVTFNTAWMMGMAYQAADATRIEVFDGQWAGPVAETGKNGQIGLRLYAPLNFDPTEQEMAAVQVSGALSQDQVTITLTENALNGLYFDGVLNIDTLPFRVKSGSQITISYGLAHFRKSVKINIK